MKTVLPILSLFIISGFVGHAQIISTIAGTGIGWYSGDGGPATAAMIKMPMKIVFDSIGNLYFDDHSNHRIRKIDTTGIISTVAGNGGSSSTGDGGPATDAGLAAVYGLGIDRIGNLYIPDGSRIRKVTDAGYINTIAGNGIVGDDGDGGPATDAHMEGLNDVAVDAIGNLFIAYDNRVRKVDTNGIITAFAGVADSGFSGDGGPATAALFHSIGSLATDAAGNVFIVDVVHHRVRMVNTVGVVNTVIGNGGTGYAGDGGPATAATLSYATGAVNCDTLGNQFVADGRNYVIRMVSASGIIHTVAGNGIAAYGGAGDGGPALAASFYTPFNVTRKRSGNLYISDRDDYRIRMVSMPTISIASMHGSRLCAGIPDTFTASVVNDAMAPIYQWQVNGSGAGGNSPTYITNTLHNGDTVRCILRYVFGDTVTASSNNIIVAVDSFPPVAGALSGADTVCRGDSIALTATVPGGAWSASNSHAAITPGFARGLTAGRDTVRYVLSNGCGSDTASHPIFVKDCSAAVPPTHAPASALTIYPDPSGGSFTVVAGGPPSAIAEVLVSSLTGQPVARARGEAGKPLVISLGAPPGIYLVCVTVGGERHIARIAIAAH